MIEVIRIIIAFYAALALAAVGLCLLHAANRLRSKVHVDRFLATAGCRRDRVLSARQFALMISAVTCFYWALAGSIMIIWPASVFFFCSSTVLLGAHFIVLLTAIDLIVDEREPLTREPVDASSFWQ